MSRNIQNLEKFIISVVAIATPTILGAILSHYLNIAWILLISLGLSVFVFIICLYFTSCFTHIDKDMHSIENLIKDGLGISGQPDTLSWCMFWNHTHNLANGIKEKGFDPDIIISIGRSGAIVGGMIASIMGSKKHVALDRICIECIDTLGEPRAMEMEIDKTLLPNVVELSKKKILCVMSECNTGKTLKAATDQLKKEVPDITIKTAVLFRKLNLNFIPDYSVITAETWPKLPFRLKGEWIPYHPLIKKQSYD